MGWSNTHTLAVRAWLHPVLSQCVPSVTRASLTEALTDTLSTPWLCAQDYLMLTHWLPDTPCTLPPNASHQVGAPRAPSPRARGWLLAGTPAVTASDLLSLLAPCLPRLG